MDFLPYKKNIGLIRAITQKHYVILCVDGSSTNKAKVINFNPEDSYDKLKEYDVVTFDKLYLDNSKEFYQAIKVQLATNIKSELIPKFKEQIIIDYNTRNKFELDDLIIKKIEWDLLTSAIPELYEIYYDYKLKDLRLYLDIESYLNSIDIDDIIYNYDIKVSSSGSFKAGEDETAFIYIKSFGINKIHEADEYLSSFLSVNELIESIKWFASWQKIAEEYISDNKEMLDVKTKTTKANTLLKFKSKYSKIDHRISLINQLNKSLLSIKTKLDDEIDFSTNNKYFSEIKLDDYPN